MVGAVILARITVQKIADELLETVLNDLLKRRDTLSIT
jgi:hypothetical protein